MSDLTDFLLARIAEDEAAARAVKPLDYTIDMGGHRLDETFTHGRMGYASEDGMPRRLPDGGEAAHFARHDPARVLAECEAKRRIVEWHTYRLKPYFDQACVDEYNDLIPADECRTLRALAAVYADHEDFREEWQP